MRTPAPRIAILDLWLVVIVGWVACVGCDDASSGPGTPVAKGPQDIAATSADKHVGQDEASPPAGNAASSDEGAGKKSAADSASPPAAQGKGSTPEPTETVDISFDELNLQMQENMVFRPFLLESKPHVKELDGKRVRINGFMYGGVSQSEGLTDFVLLKNTECKYGPGGQADHLLMVTLAPGETAKFTTEEFYVEGTLRIVPKSGPGDFTWSVYDLENSVVTRGGFRRR